MNIQTSPNPYPGLRAFEYEENDLFFGREGKAQEIAERLARSHFVAVVGTSGSGKSSLVRAGLLPLLYGGMQPELGAHWRISIMRPGETPIHNLANSLVYPADFYEEKIGQPTEDATQIGITEGTLRRSAVGIIDFIKNPANNFADGENLLVVVDQFEELFRFKEKSAIEDTEAAAAFVKLLIEATRDKQSRIFAVITMRSDFLGDCAEFRDLPEAINEGQYLIPRMNRDQLRRSIESPALVGNAQVSPALVNRLLNDLEDDQNQSADIRERMLRDRLPVLQHAVMRTWKIWNDKKTPDKPIDIEHYENEKIGGMAFALSNHADEAFAELKGRQIEIAEKMFKCLTATDSENRETRRPARIEEICAVAKAGEQEVFEVIEVFRQEGRTFLMPPPSVHLTAEIMIDISHESLIRNWESLKGWVKEESEDAWQYRRLAEDVCLYNEEYEKSEEALWGGRILADALRWRKEFKPTLAWAERYQVLTDEEKSELTKIRKVSPLEEEKERRKILANRFAEAWTFLDKSADKEAEEKAKEKLIQQERINNEREKAAAAVRLAEVEREKVEGLRNLTESLKRQRRVLLAVSVFSVLMMLATSVAAVVAFQYYNSAKLEQTKAEKQKIIADEEAGKAKAAKITAVDAQAETEKQKDIADKGRFEAEKHKNIADKERDKAEKQQEIAEDKKQEALEQQRIAETAKGDLEKSLSDKDKLNKNLEANLRQNKFNIDGLISFENYDYGNAVVNFVDLEGEFPKTGGKDTRNIWWARYNIAKSFQQLGDFEDAKEFFQKALDTLPSDDALKSKKANSPLVSGVAFLNTSYKPLQPVGEDVLKTSKIITLRKFAQFYRNCAVNPQDCFEINEPKSFEKDLDYFVDAQSLNGEAVELYKRLISIKEPNTNTAGLNKTDEIFLADVKKELADIYLDLNLPAKAEEYYEMALAVYTKQAKTLTDIAVRKKLLEAKLHLKNLDGAEKQASLILTKKREVLGKTIGKETIALDKSMGDTYGELAEIYQKFVPKAVESYQDKVRTLRTERAKANKNGNNQKNQNSDSKVGQNAIDEENLSKEEKNFFDSLTTLYQYYTEELIPGESLAEWEKFDELTEWKKEVWYKIFNDLKFIKKIEGKATVFSAIALQIKNISDDRSEITEERLVMYTLLTFAYMSNNETENAKTVIAAINDYSKEQFSKDKSLMTRLKTLQEITDLYQSLFKDSCRAAVYADEWVKEFEGFPNQSNPDKGREYVDFYLSVGMLYYLCGDCPEETKKARQMFTTYLTYLEKNEKELMASGAYNWSKTTIFTRYVELKILIGQIDEREGNINEAIKRYGELLSKIQNWKKDNSEDQMQSMTNSYYGTNATNANRTTEYSSNIAANSNMSANTSYTGNTMNANSTKEQSPKIDKRFSLYEAYLNVHLAELNFNENENIANDLTDRNTINVAELGLGFFSKGSAFITERYTFGLKNIGDLFKGKNKEKSIRYYQSAIEILEFMKRQEVNYCQFYMGDYCGLYIKPGTYIGSGNFGDVQLSGKYYSDYFDVLTSLRDVKGGDDATLKDKIAEAEKQKNVMSAQDMEKTKCISAQGN